MDQEKMIKEIVSFVGQHQESTASIAVYRRIVGTYTNDINKEALSNLQKELETADPEEIENCYYIIK